MDENPLREVRPAIKQAALQGVHLMYAQEALPNGKLKLSLNEAKVTLPAGVFELLTNLDQEYITKDLAKLIAQTVGTSPQAAVALLEKVTFGYKNFSGIQLLVAVDINGKRGFRSAKEGDVQEKAALTIVPKIVEPKETKLTKKAIAAIEARAKEQTAQLDAAMDSKEGFHYEPVDQPVVERKNNMIIKRKRA